MGIFSRLFQGDGAEPSEAGVPAEPTSNEEPSSTRAVSEPPKPPSKRPRSRRGGSGARKRESSLPPLQLDSDFPPKGEVESAAVDVTFDALDDLDDLVSELDARFDATYSTEPAPPAVEADVVTTERDSLEVRELFNDMAVHHMGQVRDFMLELSRVEASTRWIPLCEPAVQSLLSMCEKLEMQELSEALQHFKSSLVVAKNAPSGLVAGAAREALLASYQRLLETLPRAFELGSDREAILVQLLLLQVPGVHQLTLDKLYKAGVHRLDAFLGAKPAELAEVSGIDVELATRIAEHIQSYRETFQSLLAEPARPAELRRLGELVSRLREQHDGFERASAGWSVADRADKKRLRRERGETVSAIYVSLARIGEVERISVLETLPVERQLAELEEFLRKAPLTLG